MIVLLADANIQGHIDVMVQRMQREPWIGFWNDLQISCVTFADAGLAPSDSDAVIWHRCQKRRMLLLTNNRNDDAEDSLEATIRTCNTPESLPVFTIGNAERMRTDRAYLDAAIWTLLDYLVRIDGLLGSGRLFIP